MRKNYYVRLTRIGIVLLLIGSHVTQGQNSGLIIKGNTVSPAGAPTTTQTTTPTPAKKVTKSSQNSTNSSGTNTVTAKPAQTPAKQAATTKAVSTPAKTTESKPAPATAKKTAPKSAPVVQAKPKPAPPVVKSTPKPPPSTKKGHGAATKRVDFVQRVTMIHNLIGNRFPQKVIDSFSDANHDMLDSIRYEIAHHKDKDSISFLQAALVNGANDSIVIVTINNLLNAANVGDVVKSTGSINAYCIDLSTQAPMDSVKVSVFSHDSLVTTGFSGTDGFSKIGTLKPGEYSLSFSKNNYTPFSDRWVKVTADNVTYLEMPLTETPRFYLPRFSAEIWAMIVVGVISIFVLVYSIIRRLGRVA